MSTQTRRAYTAEYRAAVDSGVSAWIDEVVRFARAYDAAHPGEPSLLAELVGTRYVTAA
ncbi:hypothetical protein [Streptomyces kaempferi]|uniref:SAM-dependent methyltransferase n=1 Tax=Streptomyces kaempferi TaxID=333725 RepID=A0ABW3XNN9_9ACTN